jgi:endonuclease YncB( thermonuclease family)
MIASVYVNNQCLNQALVSNGLAWHFKKYSKDMSYDVLEQKARASKIGLWSDPNPTAPWDWRKSKRK